VANVAREMLLLNNRVGAAQALEWGLVNRVVPSVTRDGAFITGATPDQIDQALKGRNGYAINLSQLDDTVADSATIDVALLRVPARDPERRIGSLLVNPGGPGTPGRDFAAGLARSLPDVPQDRLHIVGLEPACPGKANPLGVPRDPGEAPLPPPPSVP